MKKKEEAESGEASGKELLVWELMSIDLAAAAEKMLVAASGEKIWFFKGKLNVIYQQLVGSGDK